MTTFARILIRYGEEAVLTHGGAEESVRVFVQPMMTRRTERVWSRVTPLGDHDTSRYLAYLPPEAKAAAGDALSVGGESYEFLKAEAFKVNGSVSHVEAVLQRREALRDG